jgi:hypothetical protein
MAVQYANLVNKNGTIYRTDTGAGYSTPAQLAADLGVAASAINWGSIASNPNWNYQAPAQQATSTPITATGGGLQMPSGYAASNPAPTPTPAPAPAPAPVQQKYPQLGDNSYEGKAAANMKQYRIGSTYYGYNPTTGDIIAFSSPQELQIYFPGQNPDPNAPTLPSNVDVSRANSDPGNLFQISPMQPSVTKTMVDQVTPIASTSAPAPASTGGLQLTFYKPDPNSATVVDAQGNYVSKADYLRITGQTGVSDSQINWSYVKNGSPTGTTPQGVPKDQYVSGLVNSGGQMNSPATTPPQTPQASQTGGNATDPYSKARTEFEAYLATLMPSADETAAQAALTNAQQGLTNITNSTNLGLTAARNRPVATPVIGGYERNIQQTAAAQTGVEQGNVNIAQNDLTRYLQERTNKSNVAKARLDFESGIAKEMAGQNAPFELSAGQSRYTFNPSTGKYEVAASVPTAAKTASMPTSYEEYLLSAQGGYKGTYNDWLTMDANRKKTNTSITYNQQQDQAQQAAIAKAQTTLAASRGKDGYIDPDIYLQELTKYVETGGNASNFEATFLGQVNPNDRARVSGRVPANTGADTGGLDFKDL